LADALVSEKVARQQAEEENERLKAQLRTLGADPDSTS
jgi:hypothetical protein